MPSQTPLSATQATILAHAATRDDGDLLPLPVDLRLAGGARTKVLAALLARGLVAEARTRRPDAIWRSDADGTRWTLRLVRAGGRQRVGGDQVAEDKIPNGKLGLVVAALRQVDGTTIEALTGLTGWLPHTTRAALCRLRQRGLPITRNRVEGTTLYHLPQSGSLG